MFVINTGPTPKEAYNQNLRGIPGSRKLARG
jgi:hypothetical protein